MRLFAPKVEGAYGRPYTQTATPDYSVTDEQAEVLVPDNILLEDLLGLAVYSLEQARNEVVRLSYLGIPKERVREMKIVPSPDGSPACQR
jgi:hypothetical protein